MPRGAPDYSNVTAVGPFHRLDDMAELAARLGSPATFDRRGRIIFIDSFEHGMASWEVGGSGTGTAVVVSPTHKRSKAFSVKMTNGSTANWSAQIARAFPYPDLNKYGLEFSVMFANAPKYLIATLSKRDGTQEHQFQIMYMGDEDELVVTIPGGSSVAVIEDLDLSTGYGLFHTFKLVADFENNEYVRVSVNDQVVDLSDYEPYTFAHVSSPHVNVVFTFYGHDAENIDCYIDDVILTQAEP